MSKKVQVGGSKTKQKDGATINWSVKSCCNQNADEIMLIAL